MEVYERLKEIRKLRGLTQTQIADKMGMAQSNFAVWESGKIEIPLSKLKMLAELLEVSLGDLLGISEVSILEQADTIPTGTSNYHLSQEVERLEKLLEAKEEVIKHREREERRVKLLAGKLLSALHTAYQNWYLDRVPSKKPTLDKIADTDGAFWIQFFSIESVKMTLEMGLLPDAPFQVLFERYAPSLGENTNPYAARSSDVYEAWLLAWEHLQKEDTYTANKQLDKLNNASKQWSVVIMDAKIGKLWKEAIEYAKEGKPDLAYDCFDSIRMRFQNMVNNVNK